jgi:hypothetical protein
MNADRTIRQRQPGTVLLRCAALLLIGLAAAQAYVSWRAQFAFIDAAKHAQLPSALEALGLDTGAVIFALLGLAHAQMGRPARIERVLNIACALGSMTMNLLSADLGSPRSVVVYVLPALLYAACSDRLIATAAHAAGVPQGSLWRFCGVTLLYGLRALVALPSTVVGLRLRLLEATPLPASAPAARQAEPAAPPAAPVRQAAPPAPPARQIAPAEPEQAARAAVQAALDAGTPVPSARQLADLHFLRPGAAHGDRRAAARVLSSFNGQLAHH